MNILVSSTKEANGHRAAAFGASRLRDTLRKRGEAAIIVATGASQFEMLEALQAEPDIAWDRVTVFHLDEYIGLSVTHPASFRRYLWERFHRRLPVPVRAFHYVAGDASDPEAECARLSALISGAPVDVCFAGIGENAHLAFNDPPADFQTQAPYLIVELDEACRRQQLGEGWFGSLDEVPRRAITMSIHRIVQSRCIVITAPDARKARAARDSFA
ncbi:MAG: 6-phosphogluconolactonase, partial [Rhodospirillales bacterium]|nr:6-phosphogluconolactonase [Acetobacter sp.]